MLIPLKIAKFNTLSLEFFQLGRVLFLCFFVFFFLHSWWLSRFKPERSALISKSKDGARVYRYDSFSTRVVSQLVFSWNLLTFYHECCSLIDYATYCLFCCRTWVAVVTEKMSAASSRLSMFFSVCDLDDLVATFWSMEDLSVKKVKFSLLFRDSTFLEKSKGPAMMRFVWHTAMQEWVFFYTTWLSSGRPEVFKMHLLSIPSLHILY